jgi:hypothetical protein
LREAAATIVPAGAEADSLADYLWRTREFDTALRETRRRFLREGPRPAVLAWYGDHQPPFGRSRSLTSRIRGAPGLPPSLQTWYSIETNPAAGPGTRSPMDIMFLPSAIAREAGIAFDDLIAANAVAARECGNFYAECTKPAVRDAYLSFILDRLRVVAMP